MATNNDSMVPMTQTLVPSEPAASLWNGWSEAGRPPPVFVLSSFRTGSTWLWQKMRGAPTTIAYYEIFHEMLATATSAQARQTDFSTWDSRHPISPPYFMEYLPLLEPQGGVAGFDPSMVFENSMPDGELRPAEKAYVERLISAAWAKKRIPVLSCTRSLGRARALRQAVGGRTVLLHRNLFHQWASYCWQAETGNEYFIASICETIAAAQNNPFLRGLSEWFELRDAAPSQEKLFQVFVLLHLYLYSIAFDTADLIVDLTEIATDASVRRHVERELSEMIQDKIDLSDVRQNCEFTGMTVACPQMMKDTIQQFAKLMPNASLSSQSILFIERAKDQALYEWERFEFFNRRTRTVLLGKADDFAMRLKERGAENDSLRSERDRLKEITDKSALQLKELDAENSSLRSAKDRLAKMADDSAQQLKKRDAENDSLRSETERLTLEGDRCRAALQAAGTEKEACASELSRVEVERNAALEKAAALEAESSALRTELAQITAIRRELEQSLARVTSERDASLYSRARRLLARGG